METTSEDKQILSRKVLRIFIRPGYGMYLFTRRYVRERTRSMERIRLSWQRSCQLEFPVTVRLGISGENVAIIWNVLETVLLRRDRHLCPEDPDHILLMCAIREKFDLPISRCMIGTFAISPSLIVFVLLNPSIPRCAKSVARTILTPSASAENNVFPSGAKTTEFPARLGPRALAPLSCSGRPRG
jgi:hypothetical protein